MEYTRKIVRNPQFIKDLQEKVMTAVDMTEVENDITAYKNQLSALQRSRDSLERDIDRIAPDDKYAERRRADMTRRLNDLYDQIYKAEDLLQESMMKKATLESEQMSVQSMIGILSSFDAIYDRMNAAERRDLVKYLISEVELFPREEQKTQKRFVKAIAYKFPIEQKVLTQFDECGASVETVDMVQKRFLSYFDVGGESFIDRLPTASRDELQLITPDYLHPYLSFIRDHRRLYAAAMSRPSDFRSQEAYGAMFRYIFDPILARFSVPVGSRRFIMAFYLNGIAAVISEWLKGDCKEPLEFIADVVISCIPREGENKT